MHSLTYAVDENAGQNEVEHVEHGPPAQHDGVRYVRVGLLATRVERNVLCGGKLDL